MSTPDLEGLFQGSARLGLLLAARGLEWTRSAAYVRDFSAWLAGYQELSLSLRGRDLGLMTRGSGLAFTHAVARYMEGAGVGEPRLRRLLLTADQLGHRNLFFKLELGPEGALELSWYFRRRPPLAAALAWLDAEGVARADREAWAAAAAAMGKRTVHFLGCAEHPASGASRQKLYLSLPPEAPWDRLLAAGEHLGLTRRDWEPLLAHRGTLEGRTCFLSADFADTELLPGAKLDIRGVPPELAHSLGRASREGAAQGDMLRELFDRRRYDYAGFRLLPGAAPSVKVYCYRQGKLPAAPA